MGDTSQRHMQRFLSAAPEWYITGINGTTGFVMGNLQLTQLGLVQAQPPDFADYSEPPHQVPLPVPSDLGRLLLDGDYEHILGRSIRAHQPGPNPSLRLMGTRVMHMSRGHLHQDLIPQGALIWAKDLGEHQALRRLTGRIVSGGSADTRYLCGISAEYESATGLARRVVGVEKTGAGPGVKLPDLFEPFDIDGPVGEVATELEFPLQPYPRGLRVCLISCALKVLPFAGGTTLMTDVHLKSSTPTGAGLAPGARQTCRDGTASSRQLARYLLVSS